jgi:hypothetical protein
METDADASGAARGFLSLAAVVNTLIVAFLF